MKTGFVSALYIYPIKSCAAIKVDEVWCDQSGLQYDRQWAIVNRSNGKVVTQRDFSLLARVQQRLDDAGFLEIGFPGKSPLTVPLLPKQPKNSQVELWGRPVQCIDEGEACAQWFSDVLELQCRFVRYEEGAVQSFNDSSPIHVVSEESLEELNSRLEQPIPIERFRPSIVIKGHEAYGEDKMATFSLDGLQLQAIKPCKRCVVVTIDQKTGQVAGSEPLKTLSQYRLRDGKVEFGHYFRATGSGKITTGLPLG